MSPAEKVIAKFGGAVALSRMSGWSTNWIYKWTYGKDRGGTGGLVPANKQSDCLRIARENGVDLQPEDFFEDDALRAAE